MKPLYFIFILFLSVLGKTQKVFNYRHYQTPCQLLIHADSTTTRIQQDKEHGLYVESAGRIRKLSNHTYEIIDTAFFSMSIEENDEKPNSQFWIFVDTNFTNFREIKDLNLIYSDGTKTILHPSLGKPITYDFNKTKFNKQHPYITITTNHLNPITKKAVFLKLFLRASIAFYGKYIEKFKLYLSPADIYMMGDSIIEEIKAANTN